MLTKIASLFIIASFFMTAECFTKDIPTDSLKNIDLETMVQDFVLESKQLHIPGHPKACNPSIIRWNNQLILSFDAYLGRTDQPDAIGLVSLNEDFEVIGKAQILDVRINLWQDPRLIVKQQRLYIVFNGAISEDVRRMFIAEVSLLNGNYKISRPEPLLHFPGENSNKWERNWIPFIKGSAILLASDLMPHRILQPYLGTQGCSEIATSSLTTSWKWGIPKPGTAAELDGDHYLALFHSIKVMPSLHSKGKPIQHYFMGAYTFQSQAPFAITAMSATPIVGKNFYKGPEYEMIKPCRVVFPCGIVLDEKFVWVAYGRQDHEVWLTKLDKKGLYKSLVPVTTK